jgi:hypothetical protein
MNMTRRFVLGATAATAATGLVAACTLHPRTTQKRSLNGHAHTLGFMGQRQADGMAMWRNGGLENPSVLTSINLRTGDVQQTALALARGHSVLGLTDGRLLCIPQNGTTAVLVNADHSNPIPLHTPEGFAFGGHGWEDVANGLILVPLMASPARSVKDSGILRLYDAKTLEVVADKPSGGLHPHEIAYIDKGDRLAITHYGDLRQIGREGAFQFSPAEPKLSLYKRQTLKNIAHYKQDDLNGVMTHLCITPEGHIVAVTNQYIPFKADDEQSILTAIKQFEALYGKPPEALSQPLVEENHLALVQPLRHINAETGAVTLLAENNHRLLRPQSICTHTRTGRIFATFAFSNTLYCRDMDGSTTILSAQPFGIQNLRGAVEIPESPYLLLTDRHTGIAVIDATTLELHSTFDVALYGSAHITTTS